MARDSFTMDSISFQTVDTARQSTDGAEQPLLDVSDLVVGFPRQSGEKADGLAVNDVSFTVRRSQTLCLVGESGCGKTVTAMSLLRLLPEPPAKILSGRALFEGHDLFSLSPKDLLTVRGGRIGMVFQDPMASLNPVMRVGRQVGEGLVLHKGMTWREAEAEAVDLLGKVGIPFPERRAKDFPHQLSGGMRQRVMIAMAIACRPALLVADEPTTALDVTVQRQIIGLIDALVKESGTGLLLISHDLGVVAECADSVAVMYAGRIVEQGTAVDILSHPRHPYSMGLLRSRPGLGGFTGRNQEPRRLTAIPGAVPGLWDRPSGCPFHPRCPQTEEECKNMPPPWKSFPGQGEPHIVRCYFGEATL